MSYRPSQSTAVVRVPSDVAIELRAYSGLFQLPISEIAGAAIRRSLDATRSTHEVAQEAEPV